jgi:hypothetical protein
LNDRSRRYFIIGRRSGAKDCTFVEEERIASRRPGRCHSRPQAEQGAGRHTSPSRITVHQIHQPANNRRQRKMRPRCNTAFMQPAMRRSTLVVKTAHCNILVTNTAGQAPRPVLPLPTLCRRRLLTLPSHRLLRYLIHNPRIPPRLNPSVYAPYSKE